MNKSLLTIEDISGHTLFELLSILLLIGIVSGGVIMLFFPFEDQYELITTAHELRSNIRKQQARANQYYEQKEHMNRVMRDDNLYGVKFFPNKPYQLIHKTVQSNRIEKYAIEDDVWHDPDIYPSHHRNVNYEVFGTCSGKNQIFFNALGKPVDIDGQPCDREIMIKLSLDKSRQAWLVIYQTGHITINL